MNRMFMPTKSLPPDYFPLSIATGEAFCNRISETNQLVNCIKQGRPVLLTSPRRYGKTSLALHAIQQTALPYALVDLFPVVDEQDIERIILKETGKLISRIESMPKRALALANEVFSGPHFNITLGNVELSFAVKQRQEKPAFHVLDILEKIERLAERSGQQIILFFDEFQRLNEITPHHAMESILRQVAQLTKSISFIFSGSNRHLLNQLFEDRKRPFYKLCERIALDRISVEDYEVHLQKAAMVQWGSPLDLKVLEHLFCYTERHSYCLNLLCSRLWRGPLPTIKLVDIAWKQFVMEERSSVAAEMDLLSKTQRKLLTVLARTNGTNAPLGQVFIQQANLSKTTIDQALNFLERKDYVFKDQEGYFKVLDPLIKAVLINE